MYGPAADHFKGQYPEDTTVILADDHVLVRGTVRALLESERGLRVIGETGDGLDAARMLESLRPNIAIVDIAMPGMNGLELTRKAAESSLNTDFVIYSLFVSRAYVIEAMRAGAKACVSKTSGLSELVLAVREVAAGRTYYGRSFPGEPDNSLARRRRHW